MIGTLRGAPCRGAAGGTLRCPLVPLDHPVEHDEVGLDLGGQQQRLLAVGGAGRRRTLTLEVIGEQLGEREVVFDQQDAGAVGHASSLAVALPVRSADVMPVAAK